MFHVVQWEQSLREQVRGLKEFAMDCFRTSISGRHEGEGTKRATVRVARLSSAVPRPGNNPDSVEVGECEV